MRLDKHKRRQSKSPLAGGAASYEASHPAVARLAIALRENKELAEQHAATAEILKVIARSPTDVQPVFDAIAKNARRLLGGHSSAVTRLLADGQLHLQAWTTSGTGDAALKKLFPLPVSTSGSVMAMAARSRSAVFVADTEIESASAQRKVARLRGFRSVLGVPMLRGKAVLGTITVTRREPGPFTKRQIGLLQTFADQAVIAIENARLFNETKEALEHQKASADILKIVASSVENTDPVFRAITEAGMRLVPGCRLALHVVHDGHMELVSHSGVTNEHRARMARYYPIAVERAQVPSAQAIKKKRVVHIADIEQSGKQLTLGRQMARASGWRAILAVPLMRGSDAIGNIAITRAAPGEFSEKQVSLVRTFADQAVIAIENARLFNETKSALTRQTASAEILRVLGSSVTDVQPVFDAIVKNCTLLFKGAGVVLRLVVEGQLVVKGHSDYDAGPMPIDRSSGIGISVLEGRTVHFPDLDEAAKEIPRIRQLGLKYGYHSGVYAPLMRAGTAIGGISVLRRERGAFDDADVQLLTSFADQAVIAIENVRLFNETKEALEQQTATADILKVISGSPTDVQPVLDAVAESAARLCESEDAVIRRVDPDGLRLAAHFRPPGVSAAPAVRPLVPTSLSGRAVLERRGIHVENMEEETREGRYDAVNREGERRTMLAMPLLRENAAIGVILIRRKEVRPFSDKQIALLKTFADQAAIAIENVRLFNETKEALDRQTATAEILRVISQSPTDTQPVFDAIVVSAVRLCAAKFGALLRVDRDTISMGSYYNPSATPGVHEAVATRFPAPLSEHSLVALAARTGTIMHSPDVTTDPRAAHHPVTRVSGIRGQLTVPLVREGRVIGVLNVVRDTPGLFSDTQIAMLKTFADQAVIAIENVRLFNETKEALERQTATAEVLKVISGSPTDVQPVFEAILARAAALCGANFGNVFLYDGALLHMVMSNLSPAANEILRQDYPSPPSRDKASGRAVLDRQIVEVPDIDADPDYHGQAPRASGHRSLLGVPLLREGQAIGAIVIARPQPGKFDPRQVAMVQTFADQAVIAIENVRLFNETKEALERQTATADILKVISASPTNVQPVLEAIAQSAVQLFAPWSVGIWMRAGDTMVLGPMGGPLANERNMDQIRERYGVMPLDPTQLVTARSIVEGVVTQLLDTEDPDGPEPGRQAGRILGYRSQVNVPLVRSGTGIGTIVLVHPEPNSSMSPKELDLLKTFADQAVIAIENARLFNETKEALDQQTATAEILKVMSASPTDVQPVFETIARFASRLCGGVHTIVTRYDGELIHIVAEHNARPGASAPTAQVYPRRPGRDTPSPRAVHERAVVHIPYAEQDAALAPGFAHSVKAGSFLAVPMLREGVCIGTIGVSRAESGPFPDKQIQLLKVFADQAVIAIENVRLFNETKEALEQQKASAEVLGTISSSVADAKPVFDKIVESCARLFEGTYVGVGLVRHDGLLYADAYHGPERDAFFKAFPMPVDANSGTGRAILSGEVGHYPDVLAPDVPPNLRRSMERVGGKSALVAPMLWEGRGIGGIVVGRQFSGPFSDKAIRQLKTFADQAVIAIQNARLFNETKEALERQTATSEVLRVISATPADAQPVFEAIAQSALRVFKVSHVGIAVVEDGLIRIKATRGSRDPRGEVAIPLDRNSTAGRSVLDAALIMVEDVEAPDVAEFTRNSGRLAGFRAIATAPMLREGSAIGAVSMMRAEPGAFTDKQLELLQTFADQAVIAIENVRLFNETKESLEQQTAISEVLRVISASPTDVKPVLDAVAMRAARICAANDARLFLLEEGQLRNTAAFGDLAASIRIGDTFGLDRTTVTGTAVLDSKVVNVDDASALPEGTYPATRDTALRQGYRTIMSVPLMREQRPLGAITLRRAEARPFTEKQIALVKTFADQAAIAIENVRLFNETKEALEQQTATTEVLNVISSSITDASPVFDAIARSVLKLYGARNVGLVVRAGETIDRVGYALSDSSADDGTQALYPIPLDEGSLSGRAILRGEVIHIRDVETEKGLSEHSRAITRKTGVRSVLIAPMYSMGATAGALAISRRSPGGFSEREVEMIRTFADQAVIAMENVRLFREIEEKSRQLETASQHKSHFLASMSHELRTPLNAILGFNEMILDGIYGDLDSEVRAPLENIQSSGKHLLRLINNVLDLAKIEAGRMELALSDYSVQDTVASVHSTLKPLAAENGVQFVADVPADIPLARGDAGRIAQCLMNLAGNSLKFTKAGRVAIAVTQDDGRLRFSVADTGIGIPADKIPHLFTEFKQTDATVASEYGGTGLGLSITKKFIEMHGGRIWVDSEPGKGSNFQFEIPLRAAA